MDILIRLYVRHDTDLLSLYRHPDFSLASAMRDSLIAYVRNDPVKYIMPRPYVDDKETKRNASLHLYFHPQEDEDIIDFLKGVREGSRCALIKNILRGYMMYPNIYGYCEEQEEAVKHALSVYGKTAQKTEETGLEFTRGRGNRGKRKAGDENYGKIVPEVKTSTDKSEKEENTLVYKEESLVDIKKSTNDSNEHIEKNEVPENMSIPEQTETKTSDNNDFFDSFASVMGEMVDNFD